ncbi:lactate/malate family dehydrogenase [Furfurilactobacillus entadae]|uniref:lactate/malate family dehydrogenase n=1 Tax=Furfurilactobacillus entadae TaxID=2922307 RepID=UPI0035EFDFB4
MKPKIVVYGTGSFNETLVTSLLMLNEAMTVAVMDSADATTAQQLEAARVAGASSMNVDLTTGTATDLVTADAIVIGDVVALAPEASRDETLAASLPVIRELMREAMAQGFTGKIVVAGQYDGLLTYFAQRFSGISAANCIGIGTLAHSHILTTTLAKAFNVNLTALHAYVIGIASQHVVAWSRSTVGPVPVLSLMANEDINFDAAQLGDIEQRLNEAVISSNDVVRAQAVIRVIQGLFLERPLVGTLTNLLTTMDGQTLPLSTPVRLNAAGVSKLVDVTYSDVEQRELDDISDVVREATHNIETGGLGQEA